MKLSSPGCHLSMKVKTVSYVDYLDAGLLLSSTWGRGERERPKHHNRVTENLYHSISTILGELINYYSIFLFYMCKIFDISNP